MKRLLLLMSLLFLLTCGQAARSAAPSRNSDYFSLCDQAAQMTQAAWEAHFSGELAQTQVHWFGQVTDVRHIAGDYYVFVDLGNGASARLQQVPEDVALALVPDQEIEFSGRLEFFGHNCGVDLIDVKINGARD